MLSVFRAIALVAATMTTGLMAGVFGLYAHTIMPGLGRTDDRTFVGAFQAIDRAIINPWFLAGGFLGAFAFTCLAAILHLGADGRAVLWWTAAALVLYLATLVITVRVHLPRNDEIKRAADPGPATDVAALRERFDEARWARWNLVRTVTTTAAFGCLVGALVRYGSLLPGG